jgi:hypothetical protein
MRSFTKGGGNAFAKYNNRGKGKNPFELDYRGKDKQIGEVWTIRILSLAEDDVREIPARKATIINSQSGSKMQFPIPDPGHPLNNEITDHTGKPLSQCESVVIYRMPVWVYKHTDEKGKVVDVNELKYLEFTEGIRISLQKLEQAQGGKCAFDPDTGRPEYDVDLKIVYNNEQIKKKYELEPVLFTDDMDKHPNFKVKAEKALAKFADQISEKWDELQEAMDSGTSEAEIRDAVKVWTKKEEEDAPTKGLSRTPTMSRASGDDESVDEAGVDQTTVNPRKTRSRSFNFNE